MSLPTMSNPNSQGQPVSWPLLLDWETLLRGEQRPVPFSNPAQHPPRYEAKSNQQSFKAPEDAQSAWHFQQPRQSSWLDASTSYTNGFVEVSKGSINPPTHAVGTAYEPLSVPNSAFYSREHDDSSYSESPPMKRRRTGATPTPPAHNEGDDSSVVTGVQSCCSSCPAGPPCAEPECVPCAEEDCPRKGTSVVSCSDESCSKDACPKPCLTAALQNHQPFHDGFDSTKDRMGQWDDDAWNPQMSQSIYQYPPDGTFNSSPMTSTMVDAETQYTPQSRHMSEPPGELSQMGAMFDPSNKQYSSQAYGHSDCQEASFPFNCQMKGCSESIPNFQMLKSHLHEHADMQRQYPCPLQDPSCPDFLDVNPIFHLQNVHGYDFDMTSNTVSCPAPTCTPEETYNSQDAFHLHFDYNHSQLPLGQFVCDFGDCGTGFEEYSAYNLHIATHIAPLIPAQQEDDIDLEEPIVIAVAQVPHYQSSAILPSPDSGVQKAETLEKSPLEHSIVHLCRWCSDGGKPCGVVFRDEETLQEHVTSTHIHKLTKSSGYRCQWQGCDRESKLPTGKDGFAQKGKLWRHMHSHTNYKPEVCTDCGERFSAKQSLKQHMNRHTGEKPWVCKVEGCGMAFKQQHALTIHERTRHSKEKPLKCEFCGAAFPDSSNLTKHKKTHKEFAGAQLSCPHEGCKKSFVRQHALRDHLKRFHGEGDDVSERDSLAESSLGAKGDVDIAAKKKGVASDPLDCRETCGPNL